MNITLAVYSGEGYLPGVDKLQYRESGIIRSSVISPKPLIDRDYIISENVFEFNMRNMTIDINKKCYLEQLEQMDPKPDKLLKILK